MSSFAMIFTVLLNNISYAFAKSVATEDLLIDGGNQNVNASLSVSMGSILKSIPLMISNIKKTVAISASTEMLSWVITNIMLAGINIIFGTCAFNVITRSYPNIIIIIGKGLNNKLFNNLLISNGRLGISYALAYFFDRSSCLCFCLPKIDLCKKVKAELDINWVEPFRDSNSQHQHTLKRYETFEIPDTALPQLCKVYDGVALYPAHIAGSNIIDVGGNPINDPNKIDYQAQRLDENDNLIDGNVHNGLPEDAGRWRLTITSSQYLSDPVFSNSYYGHRALFSPAIIERAMSFTRLYVDRSNGNEIDKPIKLTAIVRPADCEALTCKRPSGQVQFYINGKPYGNPVDLEVNNNAALDQSPYQSSIASVSWLPIQYTDFLLKPEGINQQFSVEFLGDIYGTNYKSSMGLAESAISQADEVVGGNWDTTTDDHCSTKDAELLPGGTDKLPRPPLPPLSLPGNTPNADTVSAANKPENTLSGSGNIYGTRDNSAEKLRKLFIVLLISVITFTYAGIKKSAKNN